MQYSGLHYTSGLVQRKNVISEIDADVVSLMKQAGAIMLGITNVAEMVMHWESNNHIYGRSKNPYDVNRTVGGSSGGEVISNLITFIFKFKKLSFYRVDF